MSCLAGPVVVGAPAFCRGVRVQSVLLVLKNIFFGLPVPARASSGRAVHARAAARPRASFPCHWGGRLLRCGAGVRWAKLDLAWEFGRGDIPRGAALRKQPAFFHSCGGPAAAAGGTDFDPPAADCSDAQRDLAPQDRAPILSTFCSFVEIL
jgi:hypothetical protein